MLVPVHRSHSSSNTPYASSAMLHIHIDMSLTRSLALVGQGHIRSTSIGDNNGLRGGAFWNPDTQVGNGFFVSIRHIHWHNNTSLTKNQKIPTINAGAQVLALISTPLQHWLYMLGGVGGVFWSPDTQVGNADIVLINANRCSNSAVLDLLYHTHQRNGFKFVIPGLTKGDAVVHW